MFESLKALKDFYVANGLDALSEDLVAQSKPCVTFESDGNVDAPVVGGTRVGGLPDLPHDVEWPAGKLHPQSFIMQLRLSDMDRRVFNGALPEVGSLWFFVDWCSFDHHFGRGVGPEGACVIWHDGNSALPVRREPPAELPVVYDVPSVLPSTELRPVFGFDPVGIDAFSSTHWPSRHGGLLNGDRQAHERDIVQAHNADMAVLRSISRARQEALQRRPAHHFEGLVFGGHEDPLEHPPNDGSLVPCIVESLAPGNLPPSRSEDWQQLLQIRLTSRVAPFWDIAATFFITRQHLVARRFDLCRCVFECD
jgi:hypothetical protein